MCEGEPFLNDRVFAYLNDDGKIDLTKKPVYFISAASYESSKIVLTREGSQTVYTIPYGVSVQSILDEANALSGRYKIIETNDYGSTEYYGIYIKPGDIQTNIKIERALNGIVTNNNLNLNNANLHLSANNVIIQTASNELDPYGTITISKKDKITTYQLDEIDNIILDEEGNYTITVTAYDFDGAIESDEFTFKY